MLQFDDVLIHILGEFGKYQKLVFVLLGMIGLPAAYNGIAPVFLLDSTDSWCKVPDTTSAREIRTQMCLANITSNCAELVKNLTIPRGNTNIGCGYASTFNQCYRYNVTQLDIMYAIESDQILYANDTKIQCDHGWEYDTSQYRSTVTQQFDLVCDREYLKALSTSLYMAGFVVGSIVFGIIVDTYGRKFGFLFGIVGMTIAGVITAFAQNYWVFAMSRFFVALFGFGAYLAAFILATEMVGPSKRTVAGMVFSMFFGVGYMMLALYAYFVREWKVLQLVTTVPTALFLSYWWLVPESPRWLLSVGKKEEAEGIIRTCGRINNVTVPGDIFSECWNPMKGAEKSDKEQEKLQETRIFDLVRHPKKKKVPTETLR